MIVKHPSKERAGGGRLTNRTSMAKTNPLKFVIDHYNIPYKLANLNLKKNELDRLILLVSLIDNLSRDTKKFLLVYIEARTKES
jgi:hypothetical protein